MNNTGNGESAEEYAAKSDVLVLNFALHYLQPEWETEFRPEMTEMLKSLMVRVWGQSGFERVVA